MFAICARRIFSVLQQAFLRADFSAITARNTAHPVDLPNLSVFENRDRVRRALLRTDTAENTASYIDAYGASGSREFLSRVKRVSPGGRPPDQRFQYSKCHAQDCHAQRSVQLTQGSMVNIKTGTSASSQPCSI
jgi:hypothetical protein